MGGGGVLVMSYQQRRISRITNLASTNLSMAITMIGIEAGLLAFVFTFFPKEILEKGGNLTPIYGFEGCPIAYIPLNDLMLSFLIFSIFAFGFSFIYSHDALDVHAKAREIKGEIPENVIRSIETFANRGILGFKVGVTLLLTFILAVLYQIVYIWSTFFFAPLVVLLSYVIMYAGFLIFFWLRTIQLKRKAGSIHEP
jgi:hypothetical protein